MKKLMLTGLFLLLGAFAVFAQNLPSIRIVNNTGHQIFHIFVSPVENEIWGDDFLGTEGILENNQTFTCQLPEPLNKVSMYDVRLVDEEGNSYIKPAVTMTNNARLIFTFDDLDDDQLLF